MNRLRFSLVCVWIVVMAGCEAPTCLHSQPTNQTHINTNLSILVRMNYGTLIKTHLKNDLLLNAFLCFENHHVAPMENICEYCVNIGSRAICGLFLWCCATLVFPVFFSDDKFRKFRLPFYSSNAANHDSSQIQAPFSSNDAHFQEFNIRNAQFLLPQFLRQHNSFNDDHCNNIVYDDVWKCP